jgi:hypothetical protein
MRGAREKHPVSIVSLCIKSKPTPIDEWLSCSLQPGNLNHAQPIPSILSLTQLKTIDTNAA